MSTACGKRICALCYYLTPEVSGNTVMIIQFEQCMYHVLFLVWYWFCKYWFKKNFSLDMMCSSRWPGETYYSIRLQMQSSFAHNAIPECIAIIQYKCRYFVTDTIFDVFVYWFILLFNDLIHRSVTSLEQDTHQTHATWPVCHEEIII